MSGFKINRQGIRQMSQEIEREFAKHPVRVPVRADLAGATWPLPPAATVINYHGPVVTVNGDGARLAWNAEVISQSDPSIEQVAPGFENLAQIVSDLLANLDRFSLAAVDAEDLQSHAEAVLREVTATSPDLGFVRRGITMIKGLLAPASAGAADAITEETAELAREVINLLGRALPF